MTDKSEDASHDVSTSGRQRFVPRSEFAATSKEAPAISVDAFRADQNATSHQQADGPHAH